MLGLLGSAMAGGAQAVDKVSQGRIVEMRERARQKLRQDFTANQNQLGREHQTAMQEDSQQFSAEQTEQQAQRRREELNAQNQHARNSSWTVQPGRDGSLYRANPITGEVEPMKGGQGLLAGAKKDLTDREKLAVESINSEIKAIRDNASDLGGAMSEQDKMTLGRLTAERNRILSGSSGGIPSLNDLLNGQNGASGTAPADGSADGAGEPQERGLGSLVNRRLQSERQAHEAENVEQQIEEAGDNAERILKELTPGLPSGFIGQPVNTIGKEVSRYDPQVGPEKIAEAEAAIDRLLTMSRDEAVWNAMSDRQRASLSQTIIDLRKRIDELRR